MKVKFVGFLLDEDGYVLKETRMKSVPDMFIGDKLSITINYDFVSDNVSFRRIRPKKEIEWMEHSCNCVYKPQYCGQLCVLKNMLYREEKYKTYGELPESRITSFIKYLNFEEYS